MSQPNIALQVINAIVRHDRLGTGALSSRLLAEDVAPKFPDFPVAFIRLIAEKLAAAFYDPLPVEDVNRSDLLTPIEKADVCQYLATTYRANVDALQEEIDRRTSVQ